MDKLYIVNNKYKYDAFVISVYPGDTITVEIDLGFNIKITKKVRLYGINTYELRGEEREKRLKGLKGKKITLYTIKDKTEKYGRFLCIIHYLDDDKYFNLNNNGKLFMI